MRNLFKTLLTKPVNIICILMLLTIISCNDSTSVSVDKEKGKAQDSIQKAEKPDSKIDNSISFANYCNERYGYCIDYPKDILSPQPESTNGDGRVFNNKQDKEILRVYGRNNFENISLEQQYKEDLKSLQEEYGKDLIFTSQVLEKSYFIISGSGRGKIFYQKAILKEDAFAYAVLQYNENEKEVFNKLSERILQSFK